jgi:hypothetical protein
MMHCNLLFLFHYQILLHNAIPDHTGSMDGVLMKIYRLEHPYLVERLLGGLDNWDAEHFIFNAHSGYDKQELSMAFFPLLPTAMWGLSKTVFSPLGLLLPQRSVMLISGAFLNFITFPLAVIALYLLTLEVCRDKKLALLAAGLFSLNPASVFMSAVYSETLFSLFTFSGLLALEKHHLWLSSVVFSLATFTRSNGTVLCGFIGYRFLLFVTDALFYQSYQNFRRWLSSCTRHLLVTLLQCLVIVGPFCGFQFYGYILYCRRGHYFPPIWCSHSLPLPYSYIQAQYWGLGFLKYYEIKQIPNFLLATPMVILVLLCAKSYFFDGNEYLPLQPDGGHRRSLLARKKSEDYIKSQDKSGDIRSQATLNRRELDETGQQSTSLAATIRGGISVNRKMKGDASRSKQDDTRGRTEQDGAQGFVNRTKQNDTHNRTEQDCRTEGALEKIASTSRMRPYVFHVLFLTTFCVLNMHVQVSNSTL